MIDKSSSSFIISQRQLLVSALVVILINVIFVVLGSVLYVHYSAAHSDSMCGGGRTDFLRKIEHQGEEITQLRAEIREVSLSISENHIVSIIEN